MKVISRIAALAVLLSPLFLGHSLNRESHTSPGIGVRRPVTPDSLQRAALLRFSISRDALQSLNDPADSSELDYELVSRLASDLGVSLAIRPFDTADHAAAQLRSGLVDVAVLPAVYTIEEDLIPADPCREPGENPTKGFSAFVRADSPELATLLNATVRRTGPGRDDADPGLDCNGGTDENVPASHVRRIARYASLIAKHADAAGLDWRLIAALIFEESSFRENAVSPKGAQGLMQVMPGLHLELGLPSVDGADANIQAGVAYLRRLSNLFQDTPSSDRYALVLASYLLGPGHVVDAQALARELGLNPRAWQRGLTETLPLLEDERFFSRTRLGYAQGRHAVVYVNRILERYELYRRRLDVRASVESTRGNA
jgi:membrane-bound lytic murein transglycosylase MltF